MCASGGGQRVEEKSSFVLDVFWGAKCGERRARTVDAFDPKNNEKKSFRSPSPACQHPRFCYPHRTKEWSRAVLKCRRHLGFLATIAVAMTVKVRVHANRYDDIEGKRGPAMRRSKGSAYLSFSIRLSALTSSTNIHTIDRIQWQQRPKAQARRVQTCWQT